MDEKTKVTSFMNLVTSLEKQIRTQQEMIELQKQVIQSHKEMREITELQLKLNKDVVCHEKVTLACSAPGSLGSLELSNVTDSQMKFLKTIVENWNKKNYYPISPTLTLHLS